jgi:hypothetical protein
MKTNLKHLVIAYYLFGATFQLHSQGYLVPNGVTYAGFDGSGYGINVIHDPTNQIATGFDLVPNGKTPPSSPFVNTYQFDPIVDVGVRVFLVSPNDPISLQPILSDSYTELTYPNSYVFDAGTPFYVGLYTGNVQNAPPNGIYSDPLFGWAELENVGGTIELLNSAEEYQGGGIIAGTDTIIPIPEPSVLGLSALGGLLLAWRRWKERDFESKKE